ncbi:acyl-CoA thioesterase [Paraburkholderia mimosarum]|uniref:acyl-CoA thioesterase n=1 Tax=Paraburkholderia mimosarum TaxID=312026 RepID=UPI0039C4BB8E
MNFHTRKWVKPGDLNPNGTLFGGSLLRWIDEEAAIYAICQLDNQRVVTKFMSEINFVSSARQGDIIELGMKATHFGRTSITLRAEVRNKITRKSILTVERMVFVNLGADGAPTPHGRDRIRYADEAYERYRQAVQTAADATALAAANEAARETESEDASVH